MEEVARLELRMKDSKDSVSSKNQQQQKRLQQLLEIPSAEQLDSLKAHYESAVEQVRVRSLSLSLSLFLSISV